MPTYQVQQTWRTKRPKSGGGSRAFQERFVIPAWMKFAQERAEHRFTLFGTDIDMIRPENFNGVCSYGKV